MRHKKTFNHLSRKSGHRKAMMANMASSLIKHKRIETTTAKAKALKRYIEPLVTRSKDDSTHSRRVVFSYLQDKDAVTELFREVSAKVGERPGGYTRIIKLGNRQGDNADMCLIELVDYNENLLAEKAAAKKSTGRRRRGGKKKSKDVAAPVAGVETAEAAVEPETTETEETADEVEVAESEEAAVEAEVAEKTETEVEDKVEEVKEVAEATETEVEDKVEEVKEVAEEPVEEPAEEPAKEEPATEEAETETKAESGEEKKEDTGEQEAEDEDKKE